MTTLKHVQVMQKIKKEIDKKSNEEICCTPEQRKKIQKRCCTSEQRKKIQRCCCTSERRKKIPQKYVVLLNEERKYDATKTCLSDVEDEKTTGNRQKGKGRNTLYS